MWVVRKGHEERIYWKMTGVIFFCLIYVGRMKIPECRKLDCGI
jgi:hypothetical protein